MVLFFSAGVKTSAQRAAAAVRERKAAVAQRPSRPTLLPTAVGAPDDGTDLRATCRPQKREYFFVGLLTCAHAM